jgi:ferric-dicitrate binding protein FerR (iron transport regulator)
MTDQVNNEHEKRDEEALARLMRIAGPRPDIPPDVESRVYERVLKEWQVSTAPADSSRVYESVQRSWRMAGLRQQLVRWALPLAVAASAVLVAIMMQQPEVPSAPPVGTVARVIGLPAETGVAKGDSVYPGATLTTGDGQGLSLLMVGSESVRLDSNSVLRIDERARFTLLKGRVYADTGRFAYRNGRLQVDTGLGVVTDVGTQFAVEFDGDTLDIAVREGRVDVQQDADAFVAIAGERLVVREAGSAEVTGLAPHSAYWSWAADLAPRFDIENKSLMDFLDWASREAGLELVFASDELRMAAMRTELHGSVDDFGPVEAIESVLATTAFKYRIENGKVIIEY